MTVEELANLPPQKIRSNETLMRLYIEKYKDVFGYEPNCASCSFSSDFRKFKNAILVKRALKTNIMAKSKYQLKRQFKNQILTYRKDGKPFRVYGRYADDSFIENYLKHGDAKQLAERKLQFEDTTSKKATAASDSTKTKKAGSTAVVSSYDQKAASKTAQEGVPSLGDGSGVVKHDFKRETANDPLPRKPKGRKPAVETEPNAPDVGLGLAFNPADFTIAEITEKLQKVDSVEEVEKLQKAEADSGNRVGATEAFEAKKAELNEAKLNEAAKNDTK